ncbi:hypothetical protein UAY_02987 [Enterococcus moraviensis ATCC BAA-383]|uniref:LXG domain-containing protein n=1 Tax=Enterococcus moraviensis ATCC BAA-383 TaxID=1158609 RepID=R2T8R1_9ENTE|nr:EndoU domain-containing protein [Enterococcus moraviensis]EOH96619.1 hypothetical protein UAY_02987 [Enterococcus moraviensis ATCC BAA-383]EOT66045.1 hypothetical protein I586_02314 [Enterococcus moraviensis ATCC BAA-383]OJG68185.1 hypothetical protein RV09_GL001432 [Enterococcus moraviensis]
MTKIKKSELDKLLKTVESSNEEMYNQLYSLNHRISEFSSEPALSGDGWDSAKNKFQNGYSVVTPALSDVLGVVEQQLSQYINSFSAEVDTNKDKLDMKDLQDLYFEAQRLTAEHNKILTQLAEMPIIGKLFNEFNLTKIMDDIEVLQDFQQFVSAHSSDFDYIDELLTNIEMGITELGSDASFLGANVGFAMVDYSKSNWSKGITNFKKAHKKEIDAGVSRYKLRIQARTAGTVIDLQQMGMNMDIMNLKGPWENAARDFYMPDYQNKALLLNRDMKISDFNKNAPKDDRFLNSPILFDLSDLKNTSNFQNENALAHIFQGNLNRRGSAGGYHSEFIPNTPGRIVPGTKTPPKVSGVYTGQVTVNGVPKTGNQGVSSFFPEHWDPQFVVNTINGAYENRTLVKGNTYNGSYNGITVQMYIDSNGKIISAFPLLK